jgi:hypothetical protein
MKKNKFKRKEKKYENNTNGEFKLFLGAEQFGKRCHY